MHSLESAVGSIRLSAGAENFRIHGRHASQEKLEQLGLRGKVWPRYQAAYEIIAEALPDFSWTPAMCPFGPAVEFGGYPTITGKRPTLADLVMYALRQTGDPLALQLDMFPPKIRERLAPLLELGSPGDEFAQILLDLPAVLPRVEVSGALARWLEHAASGMASTIFTTICPDYAVDAEGRYTFASLGSGIGIVAQRVLLALPVFWDFATRRGLNVEFVVAMADCEADSPENCARVGLTREEFRQRLAASLEVFREAAPAGMPLVVTFLTSIAGPCGGWAQVLECGREAASANRWTGVLPFDDSDLNRVCDARQSLYERWYGAGVDVLEALRRQVPEYMAAARIAEEYYPGVLILGTDAASMAPFNHGLADHVRAVVYLRSGSY